VFLLRFDLHVNNPFSKTSFDLGAVAGFATKWQGLNQAQIMRTSFFRICAANAATMRAPEHGKSRRGFVQTSSWLRPARGF
jgi:hypothetical protein